MKLYELTVALNQVWDMVLDEDADLETLEDTLRSLEEAIEQKAEGLAHLIRKLDAETEYIRNEEKRLADKRKALENRRERLKTYLEEQLTLAGIDKVKGATVTVAMQLNPPSVDVSENAVIPDRFFIPQDPKLDKKSLLQALKDGEVIEGCQIVQRKSLRIR